jgi:plastocyanin domain-containing protein
MEENYNQEQSKMDMYHNNQHPNQNPPQQQNSMIGYLKQNKVIIIIIVIVIIFAIYWFCIRKTDANSGSSVNLMKPGSGTNSGIHVTRKYN